jgi:hypothetical protein
MTAALVLRVLSGKVAQSRRVARAVVDSLEDEGGAADELTSPWQASAEFVEEGPDLCGGEFSAGHAVARLRSRMKTFRAASSFGVSDMVSFFMGSRMVR